VEYCWDILVKKLALSSFDQGIFVWSDTVLRSRSLIEYYNFLSSEYQIPIALHFYAPYHGHSFVIVTLELERKN
jgi:DNA/RNA-binding domain of Phe-tRNA-synthetase-like protein